MDSARPPILILATRWGGGHLNLAQSLKGILEPQYNAAITSPESSIFDRWYESASRHFSHLLTWQYVLTDSTIASLCLQRALTRGSGRRVLGLLEHFRPRLVIVTHAMLTHAAAQAIRHTGKRVPLVFQLTDLGRVHATWFTEKQADAYLVPTSEIYSQALDRGIDKDRLHFTGRPVRRQFLENSPRERKQVLESLGLDPAVFTVFLQGGANGSAASSRLITRLLEMDIPAQIILAAGNNRGLAARYAGIEQVRVLPFTEMLAPYMAAADVIAGKAGASFITEAFMLEKPFLVTTCIAGQESANLRFIEQHNLGWVCLDANSQPTLLASIARHPDMIAEKVASIREYKALNIEANQRIRPVIDRLLS